MEKILKNMFRLNNQLPDDFVSVGKLFEKIRARSSEPNKN